METKIEDIFVTGTSVSSKEISTLNDEDNLDTAGLVFADPEPIDTAKLIETTNTEFDFNDITRHSKHSNGQIPKIITKKQRKNLKKMVKQSRKKNRH